MPATMSIKTLSETMDIALVEQTARATWDRQQRSRRRIENTIIKALPMGLIIMSVAFYLLSAPHTAYLINLMTPGWGFVAPVAFELGIIIINALREAGWKNSLTLIIEIVLILMSMMINVIGGFMAVVALGTTSIGAQADIANMTTIQLFAQFGTIPAAFQAALFLVVPVGIAIPFIAALVGEVVVKLALNRIRLEQETDDQLWEKEAAGAMYNALLQAGLKLGANVRTSGTFANMIIDQKYKVRRNNLVVDARGGQSPSLTPMTGQAFASLESHRSPMGFIQLQQSVGQPDTADKIADNDQISEDPVSYINKVDVRETVRAHLLMHPEDRKMKVRKLAEKLKIGKTTVAEVMQEFK